MTIAELNALSMDQAVEELMRCCGSRFWATKVAAARPYSRQEELFIQAANVWSRCGKVDQLEAFSHHPRIGDGAKLREKFSSTAEWASDEQKGTREASEHTIKELARLNQDYEQKFKHVFLICATGLSAATMLNSLQTRIENLPERELEIAAAEQAKITRIRLEKLIK